MVGKKKEGGDHEYSTLITSSNSNLLPKGPIYKHHPMVIRASRYEFGTLIVPVIKYSQGGLFC